MIARISARRKCLSVGGSRLFGRLLFDCAGLSAFQNADDRDYCVPVACCRWRTEQFVDLAKIANRLHVTTIPAEDKSVLRRDNAHEPLAVWRKCDWTEDPNAAGFREDANESNSIRTCSLSSKWILCLQADKIAVFAEHNFRFEWQSPEQFSTELYSRSRFKNDKRACSTHIHDIIVTQFSCEDAWAKPPVSTNIDTSEENYESHIRIGQPIISNSWQGFVRGGCDGFC